MSIISKIKSKKETAEENTESKPMTKYDRKMAARKEAEKKEKREQRIFMIGGIVVAVLAVIFLAYSIIAPVVKRYNAVNKDYISVGDYTYTQQELDFYTYTVYYDWLDTYGSYASLFGLDTSTDIADQEYYDGMTWKDYFEEEAAEMLVQYIALYEAGIEAGFEYDTDEDYETFVESAAETADENDITVKAYYKSVYGDYADADVIEEQVRFCTYAMEYYNDVVYAGIEVTDDEILAEYESDPSAYDYVDYHVCSFYADYEEEADEDTIAAAMDDAGTLADQFVERVLAGEDFADLCYEYSDEATDEEDESFVEANRYSSVPSLYADWVFDDTRVEGDVEIFEDEDNYCYTIVSFSDRYYDEAIDDEIYDALFDEKLSEIMEELTADYSYEFL